MSFDESSSKSSSKGLSKALALVRLGKDRYGLSNELRDFALHSLESIYSSKSEKSKAGNLELVKLEIRRLIQAQATWVEISPFAKQLLQKKHSPETAAYLIEIAFLHGKDQELFEFLNDIQDLAAPGFCKTHKAVRSGILARIKDEAFRDYLISSLIDRCDSNELDPLESIYIFKFMVESGKKDSFRFYEDKQEQFYSLLGQFGNVLNFSVSLLNLYAAQSAFRDGEHKKGVQLLQQIAPADEVYSKAVELLRNQNSKVVDKQGSIFLSQLVGCDSPEQQLKFIKESICIARSQKSLLNEEINNWLLDPMQDLKNDYMTLKKLSEFLVENIHLEFEFSNLLGFFKQQSFVWNGAKKSAVIWGSFFDKKWASSKYSIFHIFALVQHYLSDPIAHEESLWSAMKSHEKLGLNSERHDFYRSWTVISNWIMGVATQGYHLTVEQKNSILVTLPLASYQEYVSGDQLKVYLKKQRLIPRWAVSRIAKLIADHGAIIKEDAWLQLIANQSSLTNQELRSILRYSVTSENPDLGWRVLTILQSRKALEKLEIKQWQTVGNQPRKIQINDINQIEIDSCLLGFKPAIARFLWANLRIGPMLGNLFTSFCHDVQQYQLRPKLGDNFLNTVREKAENSFFYSKSFLSYGIKEAGFLKNESQLTNEIYWNTPINEWSQVHIYIMHILGLSLWRLDLSELFKFFQMIEPQALQRSGVDSDFRNQIGKWLRKLSPEQRSAWHDFVGLSRKLQQNEVRESLVAFTARIALLIFPQETLCLDSLQKIHLPLKAVRSVESFIISPKYSLVRKNKGYHLQLPLPAAIANSCQYL